MEETPHKRDSMEVHPEEPLTKTPKRSDAVHCTVSIASKEGAASLRNVEERRSPLVEPPQWQGMRVPAPCERAPKAQPSKVCREADLSSVDGMVEIESTD